MDLELRELNNIYTPIEVWDDKQEADYCDDEEGIIYEYSAGKSYIDIINNNRINYTFYSCLNKEDIPDDFVSSISNSIRDSAYMYLINVLNNNCNIIVEWSQIEGTTSDYSIIYDDIDADSTDVQGYKYVERKNGKWTKIEC